MTSVDVRRARTARELPVITFNDGTTSIDAPATNDALDRLLCRLDLATNPLLLADPLTGGPLRLTPKEAALIERLQSGQTGDDDFDPFQPYVDFFTQDRLTAPLCNRAEPKSRFMVSKWETLRIKKLVYAIRKGYLKPKAAAEEEDEDAEAVYDIWATQDEDAEARARKRAHVPAPKMLLPGHALSYNPPEEYLPTAAERAAWEALPEDRRLANPLPQKFKSLRLVPLYDRLVHERFSRCLDLYLCPRVVRERVCIFDPDSLLPDLPSPDDLKPYPMAKSSEFVGHQGRVHSISVHSSGEWIASCSRTEARIWDANTGRCVHVHDLGSFAGEPDTCPPPQVAWCPRSEVAVLAIAIGRTLILTAAHPVGAASLGESRAAFMGPGAGTAASALKWQTLDENSVAIQHDHPIDCIAWHNRGDYLACLMRHAPTLASSVLMHQLSRRTSQQPFGRLPSGQPRCIAFTSQKPYLVLATSQHIRVYDLMSQRLVKRLTPAATGINTLAVHPSSPDNLIAVCGEKLCWFDLDFSSSPYRTLDTHSQRINSVAFHATFPLFATGADDGLVQIFHAKVYEELDKSALIVPVRVLKELQGGQVTSVAFHPTQPWLYAADSRGSITLFVN